MALPPGVQQHPDHKKHMDKAKPMMKNCGMANMACGQPDSGAKKKSKK